MCFFTLNAKHTEFAYIKIFIKYQISSIPMFDYGY